MLGIKGMSLENIHDRMWVSQESQSILLFKITITRERQDLIALQDSVLKNPPDQTWRSTWRE